MILKLKRTPGIYLVGLQGCGKSVVGAVLAGKLGWAFCDIDTVIESREGMSISRIVETRGSAEYQRLESEVIAQCVHRVQTGSPLVVAVGGGAFLQRQNVELVSGNGVSIWLDCPLPTIRRRLADSHDHPLSTDASGLEPIDLGHKAGYSAADFRIAIDSDRPEDAAEAILRLPLF